jgi:MFS family permease
MTETAENPSSVASKERISSEGQFTDRIRNPQDEVAIDLRRALAGGMVGAAVAFLASYISGQVTGMEALSMLETMLPTVRFLCSAVMTASATILALMLTLLSLSHGAQYELQSVHYRRVRQIAWIDSAGFIGATIFLLFLTVPVGGAEKVPASWFSVIFYTTLTISSLLGGVLIAVVLMLYNTLDKLIRVIDPEVDGADLKRNEPVNQ